MRWSTFRSARYSPGRCSRTALLGLAALLAVVSACGDDGDDSDLAIRREARYPEGPVFLGDELYVAEMRADQVVRMDDAGGWTALPMEAGCGPTAVAPWGRRSDQQLVVLCHLTGELVAIDRNGREVRRWTSSDTGFPLRDPNDAHADNFGGVYFSDPGSFSSASSPEGRLLYLDRNGSLEVLDEELFYPNGVYFDPARSRLLVSEHLAGRILEYPVLRPGQLGARTVFALVDLAALQMPYEDKYAEAGPDGIDQDSAGNVHVAVYGTGAVLVLDRTGVELRTLETDARFVTNVAFGNNGRGAVTGVFDNASPPYTGEVLIWAGGVRLEERP